jgi:hypothetical protein
MDEISRFVCPHCGGTFHNDMLGIMRESKLQGGSMVVMTSNANESRPCPLCHKEIPFDVLFAPPKAAGGGTLGCIGFGIVAAVALFFLARGCAHATALHPYGVADWSATRFATGVAVAPDGATCGVTTRSAAGMAQISYG